jgi:protein-disulfide isomerase
MAHHDPVNDLDLSGASASPTPDPAPDPVRTQNRVALFGTVALVVALAFGGGVAVGRGTAPASGTNGPGAVLVPATAGPGASVAPGDGSASASVAPTALPSSGPDLPSEGNRLGRADARVVVDYWADFQCPFCAKFARESIPQLVPLIEDGTIALVHRDFAFIGSESLDAAVAVRCAGRDGRYWAMHDAVYAAQKGENEGAFARPALVRIAESVGLDGTRLEACLDDQSLLVDVLDDTSQGMRLGVESTPTVIVNGTRFLGVPDIAKVKAAIEAELAGATPAPQPSPQASPNPWSGVTTNGREAGDPAAPVTVDLWMDYQAAESVALNSTLAPELRTRIAAGKVRVVLHDLALLGDASITAASALRCTEAQGGPTWFMHDILASAARGKDSGIFTTRNLLQLATRLGMDVRAFDACLADPATAQAVKDETAKGKAAGLTAAPVVIVSAGGTEKARFSGAADPAKVLEAIDAAR